MPTAHLESTHIEVDLPAGWTLTILPSRQVAVRNDAGLDVGMIEAPWAATADGEMLATHFTILDNVLTQHVALPDDPDSYPVVIDPTYKDMSNSIPHTKNGIARNYMRGFIRPEKDIAQVRGYYPRWGNQNGVLRAVRQGGECGWSPDTAAHYDFQVACKSHDYCYDLRRTGGYSNVTRLGCDDEFLVAMRQDCESRSLVPRVACNETADEFYAMVRLVGRGAEGTGRSAVDTGVDDEVPDPPDDGLYPPLPPGPWEQG